MAATFGDFLRAGRAGLDAAHAASAGQAKVDVAAAAGQLHRLAATMARCAADLVPYRRVSTAASRSDLDSWTRAVIDTRDAFRLAAAELRPPRSDDLAADAGPAGRPAWHLAAAAASLAAGRDLLQTHFSTDSGGAPLQRSDWSQVITSAEVTGALMDELASWARQLAPIAATLSDARAGPGVPAGTREGLRAAAQWLSAVGHIAEPAQQPRTGPASEGRLLHAIPAHSVPPRTPPGGPEPVAGLCEGIAVSAERLRILARRQAADARWSPAATAAAWRSTAAAAAAAGHASELVLRSLAERARDLGHDPENAARLQAAAGAVADAWPAWLRVVRAWGKMTTETSSRMSAAVTEASDLLLRMGRLASSNPAWTPGRRQGQLAPLRDPAALAPDRQGTAAVLSAVHQTWNALAKIASADVLAVGAAAGARRLYIPAAYLGRRIRYRFGGAPGERVDTLFDAYWAAVQTSRQAVKTLDAAATAHHAPSSLLAAARQAASHQRDPGRRREPSRGEPSRGEPSRRRAEHALQASRWRRRGPIERAVRRLGLADPVVVLRAAVIDQAGQDLLAEAAKAAQQRGAPATSAAGQQPAAGSDAAQLAAQAFPLGPPSGLASGQAGNRPAVARPGDMRRHPSAKPPRTP